MSIHTPRASLDAIVRSDVEYQAFLAAKAPMAQPAGLPCSLDDVPRLTRHRNTFADPSNFAWSRNEELIPAGAVGEQEAI